MSARALSAPTAPLKTRDLGPNQIIWLREKVAHFAEAEDASEKALAHAAESVRKINGGRS